MAEPGSGHYCNADNLRFRAAGYEAVPATAWPIRRPMVRRLPQSADTKAIWESLRPRRERHPGATLPKRIVSASSTLRSLRTVARKPIDD
jgi:hypothetical protein